MCIFESRQTNSNLPLWFFLSLTYLWMNYTKMATWNKSPLRPFTLKWKPLVAFLSAPAVGLGGGGGTYGMCSMDPPLWDPPTETFISSLRV